MIINSKIKDLPKIERPREKLIKYGPGHLTNSELLAIILRSGKKGENVVELANKILKKYKAENLPNLYLKPEDVWKELKDIRDHKKEHFIIFFLDSRNQEIKREVVSIGSLNASLVHPREVFEPAVKNLAAQVILAHNHPSGDTEPSEDDLALNKRLEGAGKILGIEVVDHIIVGQKGYLSFKEKGLM